MDNGGLEYFTENHPWLSYNPNKKINENQSLYNFQIYECATKPSLISCLRKLEEATSNTQIKEKLYVNLFCFIIICQ